MSLRASWHHVSDSPLLQRSSHCVEVVNLHAYVFGGELVPRQPRDSKIFQINLNSPTPANDNNVQELAIEGNVPQPRMGSASTSLNGKIYVFSGRGGEEMTPIEENGAFWTFDCLTLTWSLLAPSNSSESFPQARSYHCATNDGTRKIFIHAGCPASGRLSDLWSFDIKTRVWKHHADAPSPPRGGASMTFSHGRLYRMNGFDGQKEQGGTLDVFNPENNTWDFNPFKADGKSGPAPRSVCALLPINIHNQPLLVTLFGEGDPSAQGHAGAGKMFDDVWAYSLNEEKWIKVETERDYDIKPQGRGWFDAALLTDSTIIVSGGLAENNERLLDCWQLKF